MRKIKQIKASGNVFHDLGFEPIEAENLRVRAQLMTEIEKYIQEEKITQAKAAILFGITQPRISDLVRGKIHLFTVDTLIAMLMHAGLRVNVEVKRPKVA
ncbi:MAG: XRE family transcriptional regulator [Nitrospirae bacterium]|nr:XRE family transcriptional regulator [Nitrospirota bacterium]